MSSNVSKQNLHKLLILTQIPTQCCRVEENTEFILQICATVSLGSKISMAVTCSALEPNTGHPEVVGTIAH